VTDLTARLNRETVDTKASEDLGGVPRTPRGYIRAAALRTRRAE
jgi:hypothetical protein